MPVFAGARQIVDHLVEAHQFGRVVPTNMAVVQTGEGIAEQIAASKIRHPVVGVRVLQNGLIGGRGRKIGRDRAALVKFFRGQKAAGNAPLIDGSEQPHENDRHDGTDFPFHKGIDRTET